MGYKLTKVGWARGGRVTKYVAYIWGGSQIVLMKLGEGRKIPGFAFPQICSPPPPPVNNAKIYYIAFFAA